MQEKAKDKSPAMKKILASMATSSFTGCIIMESISIMENLIKLGIKVSGIIENILAVKKEKWIII